MRKSLIILLLTTVIISCSNESDISFLNEDIKNERVENVLGTKKEDVLLFMNKVLPTVPNLSISPNPESNSRNRSLKSSSTENVLEKEIESVIPVMRNNKVLHWVVNFKDNNGYILLAADKTRFPIVGFQDEGQYIYDPVEVVKDDYSEVSDNSVNFNDTINNENYRMWEELLNCDEDESFDIEFVVQDLNSEKGNVNLKSSPMPDREKPLNRASMYRLGWNLQWESKYPYNYEIYRRHAVPEPALALGHYMYIMWYPSKYGYMYMPEKLPNNAQKTLVSTLLKDITEDLRPVYTNDQIMTAYIPSGRVNEIPRILEKEYNYKYGGDLYWYKNDEESFKKVHNELLRYRPVLFFFHRINPGSTGAYSTLMLNSWVVDGYQEVQVKYTKKKTFMGITVSTKTWYLYKDFFHRIGERPSESGWFDQQDAVVSANYATETHNAQMAYFKKYALLNVRTY